MKADLESRLKKLDRPPAGPNWVRMVQDTRPESTKAILGFIQNKIQVTYLTGAAAIKDVINLGIDLQTATNITCQKGAPAGRKANEELVRAFFAYNSERNFPSHSYIEFEREWFKVSREISVPISPLTVIREHGKLVPIFLCGWSSIPLSLKQRRLLMTICEDAFLSLTDFQDSPAEFLFFPKIKTENGSRRVPEIWHRGQYDLLSNSELNEQVAIYLDARKEARTLLLSEAERERAEEGPENSKLWDSQTLFGDKD